MLSFLFTFVLIRLLLSNTETRGEWESLQYDEQQQWTAILLNVNLNSPNTFFMALSKGILDDSCLTTQEYVELLSSVLEMFSLLLTEKVLLPVNVHGALLV